MRKTIVFILTIICVLCVGCSTLKNKGNKDRKSKNANELASKLVHYIEPITNLSSMQAVIEDGANLDEVKGDRGNRESILTYAINSGNNQAVKMLIENGANVNYKLNDGSTNFFNVVSKKDKELIDMFIENNADINIKNKEGFSAIDMLLLVEESEMIDDYKDTKEIIKYLNSNGLQLSANSIKVILNNSNSDGIESISYLGMVKYIINELHIANKDTGLDDIIENVYLGNSKLVQNKLNKQYIDGLSKKERNNFIFACAAFCNIDTIKELETYIDITKDNDEGINVLFCALAYNTKDVVKYLFGMNFRVNQTESFETCAINAAILSNNKEIIQLVLDNDKVNITEDILMLYPYIGNYENSDLFSGILKKINDDSMSLDTVVDECIKENNKVAVDNIAKYVDRKYIKDVCIGANLSSQVNIDMLYYTINQLKLNCKEDLLYSAIEKGNKELAKKLVEEGVSIDDSGALIIAIQTGDMEMIKFLIDKGADLQIVDDEGDNIEQIAEATNYSSEVIQYIRGII